MPRARTHVVGLLAALVAAAITCLAIAPVSASAAPALSITQAEQDGTDVFQGDERATYLVKVKNTGTTATTGPVSVSFDFPAAVRFGYMSTFSSSFWNCYPTASTCTHSPTLAAGQESSPLRVIAWLPVDQPPGPVTAGITAFGGGSADVAFAQDTFSVGTPKPFEILNFKAVSCDMAPTSANPSFCFDSFGSADSTTAGAHPFAGASAFMFPTRKTPREEASNEAIKTDIDIVPVESARNVYFEFPAGFAGNLNAVSGICTFVQVRVKECPPSAAVGGLDVETPDDPTKLAPLYRIYPEDGYIAAFATKPVNESAVAYVFRVKLRASGDYGVTAVSPLPPQNPHLFGVKFAVLCGHGAEVDEEFGRYDGCKDPDDPDATDVPFLTNPTRCGGETPVTRVHLDSFENPGLHNDEGFPDRSDPDWKSASATAPSGTDCQAVTDGWTGAQEPSFGFQPDTSRADAAAGYTAQLHIPQDGIDDPDGVANSHLKDTVVTLPEGLALNPSAADGLTACSLDQAGYLGNDFPEPNRIRFTTAAEGCPNSSKVGTAVVETPVLPDPLPGAVYLAAQQDNPFGSDFAIYLVVDDPKTGIEVTIPGKVETDSVSGQITSTFVDNPQAPVEDVELSFFTGSRASLANPDVCGDYQVMSELSPWSAVDPYAPTPDELATPSDTITVDTPASDGGACPVSKAQRPFDIGLTAGMVNARGGSYSPFALRALRPGGNQELDTVEVSTPKGLVAKLAGVPYCPELAIQRAIDRTATGDGKLEQSDPSCPEASKVGTTTVGAGAGDSPIYVKGNVYLAGPYKGAPLSLAFIVPAVAGPFDLGVQVVRTALHVDRKSAKVTAVSDGIPQILRGVPVRVRDVRVDIDGKDFTLNPSDCSQQQIDSRIAGNSGAVDSDNNRFQPRDCAALAFKPKLAMRLTGRKQVTTGKHPGIRAQVNQTGVGEAGIEKAVVRLPKSLALDVNNAGALCEFADGIKPDLENHCPAGSIVGRARAKTPLLDDPLVGNVYFVKNIRKDPVTGNEIRTLPMIVVALRGQIAINLYGESDTTRAGKLVNTFNQVPDAPVSQFNLNIQGGQNGILAVTRTRRALINLCAKPNGHIAEADMDGQNGRRHDRDIRMTTPCTKRQTKAAKRAAKQAAKARKARG